MSQTRAPDEKSSTAAYLDKLIGNMYGYEGNLLLSDSDIRFSTAIRARNKRSGANENAKIRGIVHFTQMNETFAFRIYSLPLFINSMMQFSAESAEKKTQDNSTSRSPK